MLHASFVCQADDRFSSDDKGWRLKTKPYFDPAHGMQVAHDTLEEFPNGRDQPHDEFMALGASLFIRGDGGYFIYKSWAYSVSSAFSEIFRHCEEESGYVLKAAPKTKKLVSYMEDHLTQLEIQVRKEAEDHEEDYSSELVHKNLWYLNDAISWMRIGYRKAQKRYRYTDPCTMTYFFQEIEKKANDALEHAEIYDEFRMVSGKPHSFRGGMKANYEQIIKFNKVL